MILMIDNYDSFTYNIVHNIEKTGLDVKVIRNDENIEYIDFDEFSAIILSPGPSNPDNAGITLEVIKRTLGRPILGVCLGMQAIVQSFGGKIVGAPQIMHGKQDIINHTGENIFENIPQKFKAVRYHSLCAEKSSLPVELEIEAFSSDGTIQAVKHVKDKIFGVQFHPESFMTEHGEVLLGNFISIAGMQV
jgi:anthranilate synthase component 2